MIGWLIRKVQGPSFGQTRHSALQDLIEHFENERTRDQIPLSRRKESLIYEQIALQRDSNCLGQKSGD